MARFNRKAVEKYTDTNYEGEKSFKISPEMELYTIVCTSALQPTFYVPNTEDQLNTIRSLIKRVDPVFVAQLAVYARSRMNLRTIPLVLTVELAKINKGGLVRRLTRKVIRRADEITELLAYYVKANDREGIPIPSKDGAYTGVYKHLNSLSNQIKKGLRDVFESGKFNEYGYSKYNRDSAIRLRDAMFLSHPKPKDQEQLDLFNKIANNKLEVPYTWEVELSKAGQEGKDKKQVWEELIDSDKVGYMALLRNLRNIVQAGVSSSHIQKVCRRIADPEQVRKSKQLPFRFLSAYRSLGFEPKSKSGYTMEPIGGNMYGIPEALEQAVKVSVGNLPLIDGKLLIAADVSGSMQQTVSKNSVIQYFDIGVLMSNIVKFKYAESVIGMFGDTWKVLDDTPNTILQACNDMHRREGEVGYSTNGWKVLDWALRYNEQFDRIMMFTDCQLWDSDGTRNGKINKLWNLYKKSNPNSKLYMFNLAPYNKGVPLDMRKGDVYLISGWSDAIFDVLSNIENGGSTLDEIKEIIV
jgi:60 kDa SS-A/Ro ribonucleoprotein